MWTAAQKLHAVERELSLRRHVYPTRVANHRMTQALADMQIAIFEAIAADYREAAEKERLL